MINPGAINIRTEYHKSIVEYAKHLAIRFQIADAAALGQLLKLDEAMRAAADHNIKMNALIIGVKAPTETY